MSAIFDALSKGLENLRGDHDIRREMRLALDALHECSHEHEDWLNRDHSIRIAARRLEEAVARSNMSDHAAETAQSAEIAQGVVTRHNITRWAPRCLTAATVMDIIQSYGYDNDSLSSEQYDDSVVEWEIKVEIRQLGSHSWQQNEGPDTGPDEEMTLVRKDDLDSILCGLDDYWVTFPESQSVVERMEKAILG